MVNPLKNKKLTVGVLVPNNPIFRIGVVIALVLVAVGGWFLWQRGEAEPYVVVSDDGRATLEIPKSALPSGVKAEDISVTRMTEPLLKGARTGYHLGPDGVQFRQPVSITFELPFINDGSVPLLMIADKSSLDLVNGIEVVFSRDLNRTIVSGKLTHFSDIYVMGGGVAIDNEPYLQSLGFFSLNLTLPPPTTLIPVKDVFDAEGHFIIENRDLTVDYDFETTENQKTRFVVRDVHVNGYWRSTDGRLDPKYIAGWSPDEDVIEELEYIETFECAFAGIATLDHFLRVQFNLYEESGGTLDGIPFFDSGDHDNSLILYVDDGEVLCVEEEKKDQGVIGQPDKDDAVVAPEPPGAPPAPASNRCEAVCGTGRVKVADSLDSCSDFSQEFLCIQNKKACYNYLIPVGWQNDSGCCCIDPHIETSAAGRIDCSKFIGWDANGYAVTKYVKYPAGSSTLPPSQCE